MFEVYKMSKWIVTAVFAALALMSALAVSVSAHDGTMIYELLISLYSILHHSLEAPGPKIHFRLEWAVIG